jgi:hypothetical protein
MVLFNFTEAFHDPRPVLGQVSEGVRWPGCGRVRVWAPVGGGRPDHAPQHRTDWVS